MMIKRPFSVLECFINFSLKQKELFKMNQLLENFSVGLPIGTAMACLIFGLKTKNLFLRISFFILFILGVTFALISIGLPQ